MSSTDWAGLVATFSDHRALAPERLTRLQAVLYEAIEDLGGSIAVSHGVRAAFATRR
ncbi:hypothetical protein [Streptomyces sp. NBC_01477]|uniref:hypothetical protein n=1 Tax=Streptomyces sp. NBC_01477 TaxID=2976015 RepID=UPI002E30C696|nr:hypothetical protein [Streptomyces sp. NBC_01477]